MRRLFLLWLMGCVGCFGGGGGGDAPAAGSGGDATSAGDGAGGGGGAGDGAGGGGDGAGSGGDTARGDGVPTTWGAYCDEVGAIVCERDSACLGGSVDECNIAFRLGCCSGGNACGSSFGAGVSTEAYQQCLDDSGADECGAGAPDSCIPLIGEGPQTLPDLPTTLEDACAASCVAQDATNCPGVDTALSCTLLCVELPDFLGGDCTEAWTALNACMSQAPLFCDTVNGGAAVSSDDCGPEIDAFVSC